MSSMYYGGNPIEQIDFQKEFEKELENLANTVGQLKVKKYTNQKINYHYGLSAENPGRFVRNARGMNAVNKKMFRTILFSHPFLMDI